MFPNVRLLVAAMIVSVVALSYGFAVFAAFRVNHEPLARLPSAAPPLQLLASLSPSAPIMTAAVEPFEREARPSDPHRAVDLADTPTRMPAANDQVAGTPAPEPETPPVGANDAASSPPTPDASAEREASAPAAGIAAGASPPAAAQPPGVAALEAPADQSVIIDEAGQETELVPAGLPRPAAKAAKAGGKKKAARAHATKARYARRARPARVDGIAGSGTQESSSAIGGPFVSPWGR